MGGMTLNHRDGMIIGAATRRGIALTRDQVDEAKRLIEQAQTREEIDRILREYFDRLN